MRTEIEKIKNTELTLIANYRMKWKVSKYRIRKFSRSYSINDASKGILKQQELERKVIEMESKICSSSYYITNSYKPSVEKFDWFKAGL